MRPPAKEYLAEIVEFCGPLATLKVVDGTRCRFSLPTTLLPERALYPGSTFYLLVQGADPAEKEQAPDE